MCKWEIFERLSTCVFSIAPLKRGPDRVARYVDEVNRVVRTAGPRIPCFAPRHESIYHPYFFTLQYLCGICVSINKWYINNVYLNSGIS